MLEDIHDSTKRRSAPPSPPPPQPQIPPVSEGPTSTLLTGSTEPLPQAEVQMMHGEPMVYRAHVSAAPPPQDGGSSFHGDAGRGPFAPSPASSMFRTMDMTQAASSRQPSLLPSISHAADTPSHSSDVMSPTLPGVPSYSQTSI